MKNLILICLWLVSSLSFAQDQVFFSEGTDATFYDQGIVDVANLGNSNFEHVAPPCCPEYNDKMPCATTAYTGNTSLKFHYTSASPSGVWKATIFRNDWADIDVTSNNYLTFYLYSTTALPKEALPKVGMRVRRIDNDSEEDTEYFNIADYNTDIPANTWVKIGLPLSVIMNGVPAATYNFTKVKAVVFRQNDDDLLERTLFIDDIKTTNEVVNGILDNYASKISIAPNPVIDVATLNLPAELMDAKLQISIINSIGNELQHYTSSGESLIKLDLSSLAIGCYFIRVSDGKEVIVKKVIKQ
ncbi:T9SS type A sorting domain-containing protein [Labilibacter sediminis]|nr:T9SS type A sorting domain-containing protein [Labilibacter sediminis]